MTFIGCLSCSVPALLAFSIEECRLLLSLYDDENRASADVKSIARVQDHGDRQKD